MAFEKLDRNDPNFNEKFRRLVPPQQIDHQIRQAIQFCWMALPDDKRTVEEVERQVRRIVDRALRDMREDNESFGIGG